MSRHKLVLTSWSYKEGLIQAAVLPYLQMIREVDKEGDLYLYTEEKQALQLDADGKRVVESELAKKGIKWLPQPYLNFGIEKILLSALGFLKLWWLIITKKIKFIHAFCTPAGSLGYMLSVLTGAKLIIDSYEPHAESMVENGTWSKESKAFKILWRLEKLQSKRASWCLGVASEMDKYALNKWGVSLRNFDIRPMCVNLERFKKDEQRRNEIRGELGWGQKIVAVYAGKFGGIYFDKEVFDFLEQAWEYWKDDFAILILSNQSKEEIGVLHRHTGIPREIIEIRNVSFEEMPAWLSVADFALTPVKPVPSKRYCSPIKDGEYWAMGLPVIISKNISDDSDIVERRGIGAVLTGQNSDEYRRAVEKISQLLQTDGIQQKIRNVAEEYRSYGKAFSVYRKVYQDL